MKKLLVLLALCMVLSVVMVACTTEETPTDETTAGEVTEAPTNAETEAPTQGETEAPTTNAETEAPTQGETEPPTTETETEPETEPDPDPVKVGMSFDQLYTGNGAATAGEENLFTPGQSASWDGKAVIEDYNVAYVTVWGWVAFFAETPGTFGYQIGDAEPVFDAAFSVEAEQPVIDAALSQGGKSAARMKIMIPVEYLSGEEIVIKAVAKDAIGTIETLVEFKLTKPVNPNAPVAFIPAADMASSIPGSPGVNGAALSGDGNYITVDTIGQGDPYYQLPMLNQKGTVAQYVAIKYRTTSSYTASEMFVGSGAGPNGQGDNIRFELTCDGNWQLAIVDLSKASAVVDSTINYLRWDFFAGNADATIDAAYVALFSSVEAAQAFDAKFANVYRNVPYHVDVKVDLGVRTSGGPFSNVKTFGQKLPLGETFLKNITINNMATYADGNTNTWSLKIWAWNTDYATTVAGTPLCVVNGENHNDNQDFSVDIPAKLLISGDVYYELEYLTGSAQFTGWAADAILVEGVETYVGGALAEGTYASSVVVGVESEAPAEPEGPVMIEKGECAEFDRFSFDGFYLNDSLYFETDGMANEKLQAIGNTVTISGVNTIGYRGWISFKSAPAAAFGYYIVDVTDGVVVGEFLQERPDLAGAGIANGTGYKIDVPVADLAAGTYTTGMVAVLADGTIVKLYEITLIVEAAATVEPLVVDMNTEANAAYYNTEWPAAGISTPFFKLGYNHFLACGTLDLSKYSKVEIVYSFDGTVGITDARVEAALSNAIGLKSEASAYGWYNNEPNFSGDLGHTDYVFHNGGWTAFRTAEIDISAVDYNGEVWLAIYNPEGTEIVIHSLTLIP